MELRSATSVDIDAVARLHAASWRGTYAGTLNPDYLENKVVDDLHTLWTRRLAEPPGSQHVIVADDGSGPAGFACVFVDEDPAWGSYLDNLHVSESSQGRGLGTALLAASARWCRTHACSRGMYLSVNQDNRGAQAFYGRMGARNLGSGVWDAPEGTAVPIYWFAWDSVDALAEPKE